jgi:hypothetical protein
MINKAYSTLEREHRQLQNEFAEVSRKLLEAQMFISNIKSWEQKDDPGSIYSVTAAGQVLHRDEWGEVTFLDTDNS